METTFVKEQITNTPKSVFTDKEHYLKFREVWKQAMNSEEKHKFTATHHLLYAILRNKDWRKGFTAITNKNKLENGRTAGDTLYNTLYHLHSHFQTAITITDKRKASDYGTRVLNEFLAPFKGTITIEMLAKLRTYIPTADQFQKEGTIYFGDLYGKN